MRSGLSLLTPHRQDTNSLYLTEKLNELGVEVRFKCIVGDDREGLTAAAKLAMRRSDIIIFSGGLGPTEDDLTRESVAEALGLKLQRDPQIIAKLEERFAKRGMKMSANNAKQADILPAPPCCRIRWAPLPDSGSAESMTARNAS